MKKIIVALGTTLVLVVCFALAVHAELLHQPYGNNELYGSPEVAHVLWDRTPHDPAEGEKVTLYVASESLLDTGQVKLLWSLNGAAQQEIACSRYMKTGGRTIYRAKLPALSQGDAVEYRFVSNMDSTAKFSYTVLGWQTGGCGVDVLENGTLRFQLDGREAGTPSVLESVRYLTDGNGRLHGCELTLSALESDIYMGFGMRYNAQNQRGQILDHYVVNWYTDQREKTYAPVPFYLCGSRYGLYIDTDAYIRFDMAKTDPGRVKICVDMQGEPCEAYYFQGNNRQISAQYADAAGHASPMPAWAYGVWLSANEWNRQREAEDQLRLAKQHAIPVSVLVLEAWSDEYTFYRFNEQFPDPEALVASAHDQGASVILWQIPVLKRTSEGNGFSRADESEAIENKYVLMNDDGLPYRMPDGWFGQSLVIDFTNPEAAAWFLEKRRYLVEEIGVDGFKTDGGEFCWGMDASARNGLRGRELRNAYPDLYALSYQNTLDTVTFSRAAGKGSAMHSILWAGDQKSTFDEFRACVRAILNMNLSGMPFVTFDIAGFSGELPTSELYQRAVAFAAFTPIMQVHSEASGDPQPSMARTPWNMAERKRDPMCLSTFQKYANINARLKPYLLEQADISCETGIPLLQSMAYAWPEDEIACRVDYQFMLGDRYLVAPVVTAGVTEWPVYLPAGVWRDFFTDEITQGGTWVSCPVPVDDIPVFERMDLENLDI